MGFIGVYRAVYDYSPQANTELAINEGDLLYILEKGGEDDWWKAKKKAGTDDEDEPVGLVPNNYIEEAEPLCRARSLYEYTRQTDEELSFPEDAALKVYDTSDPDWILVGLDDDYGFVPSNYIEMADDNNEDQPEEQPPLLPARPSSLPSSTIASGAKFPQEFNQPPSPTRDPASAIAGVMLSRSCEPDVQRISSPTPPLLPSRTTSDAPGGEGGPNLTLPARPARLPASSWEPSQKPMRSPDNRRDPDEASAALNRTPGGFHMYNINEMVSVMGKRKKMPTTLGINIATKTILIAPERSQDGPSQEWTGNKMTHYSREGKHVFLELVRPSKSVDFHAGAKDTAEEIIAALGELAAIIRADELPDVIMSPVGSAGTGQVQKRGQVLYDFLAQGDDEVTVGAGDEVIVVDDTKSEEWWQVRSLKNGQEGVVPSSYVEITGIASPPAGPSAHGSRSTVERNRLEEIRLTKEAVEAHAKESSQQVGPGMSLPKRASSLLARQKGNNSSQQQRIRRENGRAEGSAGQSKAPKSKPDPAKIRTWTDRSKSFSVEAQFLGVKEGKVNLHKVNGVKIAVPVGKMSREDLEYVESLTGCSFDSETSLPRRSKSENGPGRSSGDKSVGKVGASVELPLKHDHDWFQFFLDCDVNHALCERYAQAFVKESMDDSILSDVDAGVLRTLGFREGDIIKVMKTLDSRFGRTAAKDGGSNGQGGLFSGPGGALRNNTRKGRPAPPVPAGDVVDPKAFSHPESSSDRKSPSDSASAMGTVSQPTGFEDDAWEVKPTKPTASQVDVARKQQTFTSTEASAPTPTPAQKLTESMQELSLLTPPLQPTHSPSSALADVESGTHTGEKLQLLAPAVLPSQTGHSQAQGASPSFFSSLATRQHQAAVQARERPLAPQVTAGQGSLSPPPPTRPLSAPQSAQLSAFTPPPLGPQMTGSVPASLQGQIAPTGLSLTDLAQARMREQYAQKLQQQHQEPQHFYIMSRASYDSPGPILPYSTGAQMHPPLVGAGSTPPVQSLRAQVTGFPKSMPQQQHASQSGPSGTINSYLTPPLEPLRADAQLPFPQSQPTTTAAATAPAPLLPQQTGPPPPVRFGVQPEAPRIVPQPTGRRANLSQATPLNPFGF